MEAVDLSSMNLPEKEQKILDAAIKVFSAKGFSASTTSEIAKSAGIAEGTIFRYFKTKKDILRGILIQLIHLVSGKLITDPVEKILLSSDDKDMRTVLREMFYNRFKLADSIVPMARIIMTEALYHEDVREALYQNITSKALEAFAVFHKRMAEKGILRDDVAPEVLFRNILANIGFLIVQSKIFGDKFEMEDMDKEFDKVIDVILYGIVKKN